MTMPLLKTEPGVTLPPAQAAAVLPLKLSRPSFVRTKLRPLLWAIAAARSS